MTSLTVSFSNFSCNMSDTHTYTHTHHNCITSSRSLATLQLVDQPNKVNSEVLPFLTFSFLRFNCPQCTRTMNIWYSRRARVSKLCIGRFRIPEGGRPLGISVFSSRSRPKEGINSRVSPRGSCSQPPSLAPWHSVCPSWSCGREAGDLLYIMTSISPTCTQYIFIFDDRTRGAELRCMGRIGRHAT